jgi:hypothetical protein
VKLLTTDFAPTLPLSLSLPYAQEELPAVSPHQKVSSYLAGGQGLYTAGGLRDVGGNDTG